jgi:hypothetical protein
MVTITTKGAATTVWACLNPYVEREAVVTSSDKSAIQTGTDPYTL